MAPRSPVKEVYFLLIFSLLFEGLWGCSSVSAFQNPTVELKKIQITRMDQETFTLEGTLEVFNPNDMSSRFSGYQYQFDVEGQRLADGKSDRPFEVPAKGTFPLEVPVTIRFEDLRALSQKELFNRDLAYLISGTLYWRTWLGKIPLPFSFEGTFNLSDFLKEKTRRLLEGLSR